MEPNFFILYVGDMPKSVAFYTGLIGRSPVEASEDFTMFKLTNGALFSLWQRDEVEPPATVPGGVEFALMLADVSAVDAVLASWRGQGVPIVQEPTEMDFGYTFVGLDPDGHRLRVYAPSALATVSSERLTA
jgi:predicted enzyme related to lactoylglutathione lyase